MRARLLRCLSTAALSAGAGGCVVHTYQPLSGLHDPVVVDPTAPNLTDVDLDVVCVPKDLLTDQTAGALCRRVGLLFENQGARVTTSIGVAPEPDDEVPAEGPRPVSLRLELRARQLHQASHPLSWAATIATLSIVPAMSEFTFEQDVVVRDASGFLLAEDTLRGRMVHWYGFGAWASNQLLDLTIREDADEVVGDGADRDLSTDLYRSLSQTVFDARMQARVLAAGAPVAR